MSGRRSPLRATPVWGYVVVVCANYIAQVVYALHLYGSSFGRTGALLLGGTLVWFLAAVGLFRAGRPIGYWVLLAYALAQFVFYFVTEVILGFAGYGLPYHLSQTQDPIVWLAFVIGDLNFLAASIVIVYLLRRRQAFTGSGLDSELGSP
jgi:hypothetical protein